MNSLRIRLAVGFSILFTVFFAVALLIIYFSYSDFRKDVFHKRLKDRAITTFRLLVDIERIDEALLKEIDRNTLNSIYDEKVIILENGKVIYSSIDSQVISYNYALLNTIRLQKELYFTQNENDVLGIFIHQGYKQYFVLVSAYDKTGRGKVAFLRWVLWIVYISGLAIGWTGTYFFVKYAIKPLESLKKNLQGIDYNNLNFRLSEKGQGEEVDSLSNNINRMVERLEQSVLFQKDFIKYASHELRTPLAAMISITENAINNELDNAGHRQALNKLLQQEKSLAGITNSLLFLSDNKLVKDGLNYPLVRLDEMVFHSLDIIRNLFPDAEIDVKLEGEINNENSLLVSAYEPLILVAFNNLLKNAIQYSDNNAAHIIIDVTNETKTVKFLNSGKRIKDEEIEHIFAPFYRSENAKTIKGSGLGLALVYQTAKLHNAVVHYSFENDTNIFKFILSNPIK